VNRPAHIKPSKYVNNPPIFLAIHGAIALTHIPENMRFTIDNVRTPLQTFGGLITSLSAIMRLRMTFDSQEEKEGFLEKRLCWIHVDLDLVTAKDILTYFALIWMHRIHEYAA